MNNGFFYDFFGISYASLKFLFYSTTLNLEAFHVMAPLCWGLVDSDVRFPCLQTLTRCAQF